MLLRYAKICRRGKPPASVQAVSVMAAMQAGQPKLTGRDVVSAQDGQIAGTYAQQLNLG
jgi:hypothetical protein